MTATATEILDVASWNTSLRTATATGKTVIVDFHATWCGPCKQIAPHYNNLAAQFKQVVFLRVDVDNLKQIAAKYQITAMPTFLAIQSGKVVDTIKGADPRALSAMVARHAGPRIPVPPLDKEAEHKRLEGNVRSFSLSGKVRCYIKY
ncbi:thioredoxin-domain-containing protein [Meredithblackwellia eburnea MCA 4105]